MFQFAKGLATIAIAAPVQLIKIKREKKRMQGRFVGDSGRTFTGLTEDGRLEWRDAA